MDSDGYKDEYEEDDIPHRQQRIWKNFYTFKIKQEQIAYNWYAAIDTLPKGISVQYMPK